MADIAATVGRVMKKLSQLATDEALLHVKVGEDVSDLNNKLEWLRTFLDGVSERARDSRNQMEALWLKQAIQLLFQAEDTLDEFSAEAEKARSSCSGHRWQALLKFQWATLCFEQILVNHKFLRKVEALKHKLQELDNQRTTHQIQFDAQSWQVPSINQAVSLWDGRDSYEPVGSELHVDELKDQLLNGENKRKVVAIIGSGNGISLFGRKVYDSAEIKSHFNVVVWKNLPLKFSLNEAFSEIFHKLQEQIDQDEVENYKLEDNSEAVCALLQQRRYLVVLNGIASQDDWEEMSNFLPDGENGSRVLLIPKHSSEVAISSESADIITIRPAVALSLQDCTERFSQIAFGNKSECPIEFGVFIPKVHAVTKGEPWSIYLLGLLLRTKLSSKLWKRVFNYLESSTARNPVDRVLPLSFDSLPQQMKSCFLYFAAMPESRGFEAERLVRIWMAEGFTESRDRKTGEEVGEGYLKELITRSLVQVVEKDECGGIAVVAVNDRVHDFLKSAAAADGTNFVTVCDSAGLVPAATVRRLAIQNYTSKYVQVKNSLPKLRSLMCECSEQYWKQQKQDEYHPQHTMKFLLASNFLRVMDLHGLIIKELPKGMGKLIHLRYLGVRCSGVQKLPKSIGKLVNLQTLDIRRSPVENITEWLWRIEALRHVIADSIKMPKPQGVGELNNLQTLRNADCSEWNKAQKAGRLVVLLEKMRNVRSLRLEQLGTWQARAVADSLSSMPFLRDLCLKVKAKEDDVLPSTILSSRNAKLRSLERLELEGRLEVEVEVEEEVMPMPMPKLVSLTLARSQLEQRSVDVLGATLRCLKRLRLRKGAYKGRALRFLPDAFGSQLGELELSEAGELADLENLPRGLAKLTLASCAQLQSLPLLNGQLRELSIRDMDALVSEIRNREGPNFHKIKDVQIIQTRRGPPYP